MKFLSIFGWILFIAFIAFVITNEMFAPTAEPIEPTAENYEEIQENQGLTHGNYLVIGDQLIEHRFNPILYDMASDVDVNRLLFNGLVKQDEDGQYIGDLAEFEISEDGLVYTFYLKENVLFHNGELLTTADVAFTYYMMADSDYVGPKIGVITDIVGAKAYQAGNFNDIEGIKIIDELTIEFTLEQPDYNKLSDFTTAILNKKHYDVGGFEAFRKIVDEPVGTGPLKLKDYHINVYTRLDRFDDYFDMPIKVDGIIIEYISDATATVISSFGEIDILFIDANQENYEVLSESAIMHPFERKTEMYHYIGLDQKNEILADVKVRQALAYGLDNRRYIEQKLEGFGSTQVTIANEEAWFMPSGEYFYSYLFNPEYARELLNEAGWIDTDGDGILDKDGKPFELTWIALTDHYVQNDHIATETILKEWSDIGLDIELIRLDEEAFHKRVFEERDYDMFSYYGETILNELPVAYYSESPELMMNPYNYYSEKMNELISSLEMSYDFKDRKKLLTDIMMTLNQELPCIYLAAEHQFVAVNERVNGLEVSSFNDLYLQLPYITLKGME